MSNTTTIPANGLNLNTTFGPLYWGFLVSVILAGINVLQAYFYFVSGTDRPKTRLIALSMFLFNLASSALVAQSLYYYLVPHFGSLLPLRIVTSELSAECLISTIMTFISQMYFAIQLYGVSKHQHASIVAWSVALTAVVTMIFGTACSAIMIVQPHAVLGARSGLFNLFFGLAKGFGALTDVIATIAMCALLVASRTEFAHTNTLIDTLIKYVMERGILVTLIQFLLLVVFFAAPNNLYWFSFHVNVTKLYANTFFSMLNGREDLRQNITSHDRLRRMRTSTSQPSHYISNRMHGHVVSGDDVERNDIKVEIQSLNSGIGRRDTDHSSLMPTVTKTVVIRDI